MSNKRGPTGWPLHGLFARGELGISEIENRRHWQAAQRFKQTYEYSAEPIPNDREEWRDLMLPLTADADALDGGEDMAPLPDDSVADHDDDGEWNDAGTAALGNVVDCSAFDAFRDTPAPGEEISAKQTLALAATALGPAYPVVVAAVCRGWNLQQIGETEVEIGSNAATARGVGKGMLRIALRSLTAFWLAFDRHVEGTPLIRTWPLVATPAWLFADMPDIRWRRGTTEADNDNYRGQVAVAA